MADYSLRQIVYTGDVNQCLNFITKDDATNNPVRNIGGAKEPGIEDNAPASPYQQIVLNKNSIDFQENQPYYLSLDLPKNLLYNMDFGLHLINSDSGDLDMQNYQFIRYLNIPKYSLGENNITRVVLYENIHPADATHPEAYFTGHPEDVIMVPEVKSEEEAEIYKDKEAVYFENGQSEIGYYKWDGNQNKWINKKGTWGINDTLLAHSWFVGSEDDETDNVHFDIIFTPRADGKTVLHYIYLYLKPITADGDIIWIENDGTSQTAYYGRHLDISKIHYSLYSIKNLINGLSKVQRFGIWGHSELMFTINGEEFRVGPSGYFELTNFDTEYLGVVALTPQDKFTIDLQYGK